MITKFGNKWKVGCDGTIEINDGPLCDWLVSLTKVDLEAMLEELDDRMPTPGDTKVGWRR